MGGVIVVVAGVEVAVEALLSKKSRASLVSAGRKGFCWYVRPWSDGRSSRAFVNDKMAMAMAITTRDWEGV